MTPFLPNNLPMRRAVWGIGLTSALAIMFWGQINALDNRQASLVGRVQSTEFVENWRVTPALQDYKNLTTGATREYFLKIFQLYRWNFMGFNQA